MSREEGNVLEVPTSGDVRDYLLDHPEFLTNNGDILAALVPPDYSRGDKVEDFQRYMLARLQDNFSAIKNEHDDLLSLMQEHMQRQNRINASILSLLDAPDFEATLNFITHDLALILGQEAVTFFLEEGGALAKGTYGGLHVVECGFVDKWLRDRDIELAESDPAPIEVFGEKAEKIRSQALVRLSISDDMPPGLLAFGHSDPLYYATGLPTEQIECLGAVIERCLRKWLLPQT